MTEADVLVVYADGLFDVVNLGVNVAMTFFAYERGNDGKIGRAPVLRLICPKDGLAMKTAIEMAESQPEAAQAAMNG